MYIGQDSSATNQFDGLLSGLIIENYPWSEDDVSTDYNSGTGTAVSISPNAIFYLPADSSDADGMVRWHLKNYRQVTAGEYGLVAGWNFDDNLTDVSANGNNLTGVNIAAGDYSATAQYGKAIDLDGSSEYASRTDDGGLDFGASDSFTLEAWFKAGGAMADSRLLAKQDNVGEGDPGYQIVIDSDVIKATVVGGTGDEQVTSNSGTDINDSAWHHIAVVRDNGNTIKLYLDSVEKDSDTDTITNSLGNSRDFTIGSEQGGSQYFNGLIDSVRIYNRALSADEIRAHYDLGSHIQDGNMEDGDGTEWNQSSEGSTLLTNGGFETAGGGDPDFWANWTESAGDGTLANEAVNQYAGDDAMKATAGASVNTYAKQAAAVTAGKMYKAEFWTRGDETHGGQYLIYDATGAADIVAKVATGVTGATYTKITKYFTAPTGCESAEIHLYCPSTDTGVAYFDAVSIIEAQVASPESGIVADEDGLVGGWNFEETSSPAINVSGNGNGTWSGSATYSTSGRFGNAISLDEGTSDYVDVGEPSSLDEDFETLTLEAWFKWDGDNDGDAIVSKGTIWYLAVNNDTIVRFRHVNVGDGITDVTVSSLGTSWHHLVSTFDGSNSRVYLDGSYQGGESTSGTLGTNAVDVQIGYNNSSNWYWNGLIDSVRIYNRALSASEIANHYYSGRNKFDDYSAKVKLAADDSNTYLDETLTNNQDYLLSYYYKVGEDNSNPINFTLSGSGSIVAEENIQRTSTTGLVGAWNFEEGSTGSADGATIVDLSGNSNDGTGNDGANNTGLSWTSGKYGNAIDFDGTDDFVDCGDVLDMGTDDLSIDCWIKANLSAQAEVVWKGGGSDVQEGYQVFINGDGEMNFNISNGTNRVSTSPSHAVNDNTWHHIIAVADRTSSSYLYVDGVQVAIASITGINDDISSTNKFTIGATASPSSPFNGLIDSVRIYNRALTASEVYDNYKAGDWRKYELSFEADQDGAHLFKLIQDGSTAGNSIVYVDNFRIDKDLVENGSFEAFAGGDPDIPTGWVNEGLEGGEGVDGGGDNHSGSGSFRLDDADDGEGIIQGVTVEDGNWYTFGIWAKNNNQDVEAVLGGTALASTTIDLTTANNNWTKFNKTFITSGTNLDILISAGAADQDGYFDDVSLVELDSYSGAATATTTTPSTAANSYSYGRWGESSGALMMDGGDTLTYPTANNIYADQGSFSFWIKPSMDYDDYGENKYLWDVEDVARVYYNFSDYKFYFEIYDGSAWDSVQAASTAQSFTEDTWMHLAGTWNDRKNEVYLYVNGSEDGSSTWGWYAQTLPTNMYFGSDYSGTNNADVYMDDLRVYEYDLSAEDIKRMYGSLPDPSADNLRVSIPLTSGGIGIDGTGLFDLAGTFTAGWGYRTGKVSGENALLIAGSDDLQFSRGAQVDGNIYEYFSSYQGTIKSWVRSGFDGSDSTTNYIFQNGSTGYIKLYSSSGTLYFDIATTTGATVSRVSNDISDWTAGEWHHIAAVWSNENTVSTSSTQYLMELYVDSAITGNTYTNATFNTNFWAGFAPGTSYIGEDSDSANQWDGLIGGFVLENRAWSGNEVSDDYNSGTGVVTAVNQNTMLHTPVDSSDIDGSVNYHLKNYRQVTAGESGLVAGYNFEEDPDGEDVTVTDVTGTNDGLTKTGDASWVSGDRVTGINGYGYSFNGGTDDRYVEVADDDSLSFGDGSSDDAFTVEAWVNMTDATSFRIVNKGVYNTDYEWNFYTNATDKLVFGLGDESVDSCFIGRSYDTALTGNQGSWIHVAATYDGTGYNGGTYGIDLYLNGSVVDNADAGDNPSSYVAMESLTHAVWIGRYSTGYSNGSIDSIRIYNRALSADEIRAHYDLGNNMQDGNMEDGDVGEWGQSSEGSDLFDVGAGVFTAGTYSWVVYGTNTIANDSNTLKVTYVDDGQGAYLQFNDSTDLSTDLTVDKVYKITLDVKVDTGDSVHFLIRDGVSDAIEENITNTNFESKTYYFTSKHATVARIYFGGMEEGEDIWLDNIVLVEAQVASPESGIVAAEDGLVGGWNFSEGGASATTVDVSGNSNTGTLQAGDDTGSNDSATDMWSGGVNGRFGQAIEFDGTNDYVDCGNDSSLDATDEITVEAWINPVATPDQAGIVSKRKVSEVEGNWTLRVGESNVLEWLVWTPAQNVESASTISTSVWTYAVATFNNTTKATKIYINGELDKEDSTITNDLSSQTEDVLIGYDGQNEYFDGLIDSVRIYNRALSASEIANHYYSGRNKFDDYSAKVKLSADDSNTYLDETLTNNQDYLLSYYYKVGEDNSNPINFTLSGSGTIVAEENIMASSTTGLVGAWNFEEGSSGSADGATIVDLSGNSNDGTGDDGANNTGLSWTSGKYGNAIDFDGVDDYVNVTDASSIDFGTGDFSVTGWANTDSWSTRQMIITKKYVNSNNSYPGFRISIDESVSGRFQVEVVSSSGSTQYPTSSISADEWFQFALTRTGSSYSFYSNGGNKQDYSCDSDSIDNNYDLMIGRQPYASTPNYFNGTIDSVRIYNRALTASEVYDNYKAGDWRKYELSFEADQDGAHLFKLMQDGSTAGNSIVYVDNFRVDKNLVENGSFEAFAGGDPDIPTSWVNEGLEGGEGVDGGGDNHSGSGSFRLDDADDGEGIIQNITVVADRFYTFGIWAKNNNQDVEVVVGGTALASTTIDLTTANNNWTKFNKTFVASSTDFVILIQGGAADQDGYFDDVSVVELDSYSAYSDPTTTTPSATADSYDTGKWEGTNKAFLMDGADDLEYSASGVLSTGTGTVSMWWKPMWDYDSYDEDAYIFNSEDGTNNFMRMYFDESEDKIIANFYDGTNWTNVTATSSALTFAEDVWQHVGVIYGNDTGTVRILLDGAESGTDYDGSGWTAQTVPTYFYPGSLYGASANTLQADGWIDDIRIYDTNLATSSLNALYTIDPNPPTEATWARNLVDPLIDG